jgi:hypothetical protein
MVLRRHPRRPGNTCGVPALLLLGDSRFRSPLRAPGVVLRVRTAGTPPETTSQRCRAMIRQGAATGGLRSYALCVVLPAVGLTLAGLTWIILIRAGVLSFYTLVRYRWLEMVLLGARRTPERWFDRKLLVFWPEAPNDVIIEELLMFALVEFLLWLVLLSGLFLLWKFCAWAVRLRARLSVT